MRRVPPNRQSVSWPIAAALIATLSFDPGPAEASDGPSQTDPGAVLNPTAIFNRCYATLTRMRAAPGQRYLAPVAAGTLDPLDACLKVLSDSAFAKTSVDPAEQSAVIQAFNDFHRTWFKADDIAAGIPNGERFTFLNVVYSGGAPANYLTRWAFGTNLHYSTALTENSGLLAVRKNGAPLGSGVAFAAQGSGGNPVSYSPPALNTGDITNIQRMADNPAYATFSISGLSAWPVPIMPFQHFGGGVIGSQEFLILNYGRSLEDNDGGLKVPRRWAKAIVNDLLCRDLPMLSSDDAKSFVEPTSPIPFRQQASCMSCHATIDSMADTARNIRYVSLDPFGAPAGIVPMAAHAVDPGNPAFAFTPPAGRLYFRSYDNSLTDVALTDLASLGSALAATNDYYVCAASRYFEYFTGIHANLAPLTSDQPLSAADTNYRALVISAGTHFKVHGNLVALLKELLNNDFYKTASMRASIKVQN